jgi:26S proteasome regulatory subunit N2
VTSPKPPSESEVKKKKEPEPSNQSIDNMTRVVPSQVKFISFKNSRFIPIKKEAVGILLVEDCKAGPIEYIEYSTTVVSPNEKAPEGISPFDNIE